MSPNQWTLCILTLPSRDSQLRCLLKSIQRDCNAGLKVQVLYNCQPDDTLRSKSEAIANDFGIVPNVYTSNEYGIAEGRNRLSERVATPFMAYIDDDCTLHGPSVWSDLGHVFETHPVALVGLPSYMDDDKKILFKPRAHTPREEINGLHYMKVEGMFGATRTNILHNIGGFNFRKKFRDLNTRLHRSGWPTGVLMTSGYLKQDFEAPESATRTRPDRIEHIIYGQVSARIEAAEQPLTAEAIIRLAQKWQKMNEGSNGDLINALSRIFNESTMIEQDRQRLLALPFKEGTPWQELIKYRLERQM